MRLVLAALVLAALCWAPAEAVQPPRCPPAAALRCVAAGSGLTEFLYTVDGVQLIIEYNDGGHFLLACIGNLTLDNPALPRFETQLRVNRVHLRGCAPPASSYAASLAALNVHAVDKLMLKGPFRIGRAQLAGLEQLPALMLSGAELEPDALAALPALARLHLDSMRVPAAVLATLPSALTVLELVRTGATLSDAQLRRLPQLQTVLLRDSERAAVEPAGATLQKIALEAPASHVPRRLLPSLHELVLIGWDERAPEPWLECDALELLYTKYAQAEWLPDDWLRACPLLGEVSLLEARALGGVGARALRGAAALHTLRVTGSRLAALPAAWLDAAPRLRSLDLSGNRLHVLPSGLFAKQTLIWLDLSSNNFSNDVFTSLETVTSLKTLSLNNNIHLANSCGRVLDRVRGSSKLKNMQNLTELYLRNTSTEVICRDWRENMLHLKKLDLSKNKISILTYSDLQFHSAAHVRLDGSNVTQLLYTELDYQRVLRGESLARAEFAADFALHCDCHTYWAAAALRASPAHVRLRRVTCAAGPALAAAPDAALTCAAPELCLPACDCRQRPHAAPPRPYDAPPSPLVAPPTHALYVRCASLTSMPRLPAAVSYAQVLQLAHNNITHVSADDLPPHLLELDLRGNQITRLDEEVARALVSGSRRLWLGGNPLSCACSEAGAWLALRAAGGLQDARGACGRVPACPAVPRAALLAGAALLALLAGAALLLLLLLPALRLRIKLALLWCGWLPGAARDDGRRFDAFVSFSHGDERFVREQLVARLESGAAPYRLCVHYRDWAPGGWIPAQIAASVRASRRTLAVVSEHFLRSAWAQAELREAHALALREREPRLVVLLLDDPERLPLDPKLKHYLQHNTYVRWGDPWFWQKLRLALPRGRGGAGPAGAGAGLEGEGAEPALELVSGDVTPTPIKNL